MCLIDDPHISLSGANPRAAILKFLGLRIPFTLLKLPEDSKELFCLYELYLPVSSYFIRYQNWGKFKHENTQAHILSAVRATSPHAMWPLENATVCLWENDSEKGKWCFGVIIKIVLTSQAPWNGLKELQFLDQLWEPLPQRKSRHQTCLKKSAAALHIIAKPRNDPKSINWYLHSMHYYAAIKSNQLHLCLTIRVTLSNRIKSWKNTFSFYLKFKNS